MYISGGMNIHKSQLFWVWCELQVDSITNREVTFTNLDAWMWWIELSQKMRIYENLPSGKLT